MVEISSKSGNVEYERVMAGLCGVHGGVMSRFSGWAVFTSANVLANQADVWYT